MNMDELIEQITDYLPHFVEEFGLEWVEDGVELWLLDGNITGESAQTLADRFEAVSREYLEPPSDF